MSKTSRTRVLPEKAAKAASRKRKKPHKPAPWMTLEDRVNWVRHNLVLIQAASQGVDAADPQEVMDAIHTAAADALHLLTPLAQAPASIANWRAPESDDKPRSGGAR
jgi:hypothetical protein